MRFPAHAAADYDVEIVYPDAFLLDQLDLHPARTIECITELVSIYDRPAMDLHNYLLALAKAQVPHFSSEVRRLRI